MVVRPGEAIRIMTGAPIPFGADAVVPVENTRRSAPDADVVEIVEPASIGDSVRPAGEDVTVGQVVFAARTELRAGHLGVLASIGLSELMAYPRARVGVLSTGDELIEAPAPLRVGQIRDSNRHTLLGLVRELGCVPVDLGLAIDDEKTIEAAIRRGLSECDAIVTSGGVSMGDFDWVKVVLDRLAQELGGEMQWMQIAIRPAKPLAYGVIAGRPVFGLPGNPVSSMVSFELFARPALRKMMGHEPAAWHGVSVAGVADEPMRRRSDGKTHFVRVRAEFGADGRVHVRSAGGQGSNMLRSMALSDALAVLPDGPGVGAGEEIEVRLLRTGT
jgi:molybdenum cofactor synthesis domain-containing protein